MFVLSVEIQIYKPSLGLDGDLLSIKEVNDWALNSIRYILQMCHPLNIKPKYDIYELKSNFKLSKSTSYCLI